MCMSISSLLRLRGSIYFGRVRIIILPLSVIGDAAAILVYERKLKPPVVSGDNIQNRGLGWHTNGKVYKEKVNGTRVCEGRYYISTLILKLNNSYMPYRSSMKVCLIFYNYDMRLFPPAERITQTQKY